jgi:hypothetical protein
MDQAAQSKAAYQILSWDEDRCGYALQRFNLSISVGCWYGICAAISDPYLFVTGLIDRSLPNLLKHVGIPLWTALRSVHLKSSISHFGMSFWDNSGEKSCQYFPI